jgi:hypothetical protein
MQHHWLSRATVLLCLLMPWPARGGPIYWQLNGEITYNPPNQQYLPYAELDRLLPVGTDTTFLITVDPTAPNLCNPESGRNDGSGDFVLPAVTVSFGGHSHTEPGFLEANTIEGYCAGFEDPVYRIRAEGDATGATGLLTIEWYPHHLGALPPTAPPPEGSWFFFGSFNPNFNGGVDCDIDVPCDFPPVDAFGEITSSSVVPEPSTFLLLASGLAAITARRRRSR